MKLRSLLLALVSIPVLAAIDGTVTNLTSGSPQPGVFVTLMQVGQGGLTAVGSTKSGPDGKFHLDSTPGTMYLLQAVFQGVMYSSSIPPSAQAPAVQVAVYDARPQLPEVVTAQHMVLAEAAEGALMVRETYILQNGTKYAWNNAQGGTLRFWAPPGAADISVRALAPGGMPVEREARKGGEKGVYTVDFPVKPGETRFDVSFRVPAKQPAELVGRILHGPGPNPVRLVVPKGITAQGEGLKQIGTEPSTQAAIFDLPSPAYKVSLTGTGSLQAATQQPEQGEAEDDGPRIQQILPPGYERQWKWALGLFIAILGLSFWALYIKPVPPQGSKPKA